MKVHIVCYEDVDGWILGKIASRLCENLITEGIACDISKEADLTADINHHIIYLDYNGQPTTVDTMMITHVDTAEKLDRVQRQLTLARLGICFSSETVNKLVESGVPRDRLAYVLPAHDEVMKPRPTVIGLTGKIHSDGRKREGMLVELAKTIKPEDFSFKIMGMGWDQIVSQLRELGFQVEYYDAFDYTLNQKFIPSLDYYLYFGMDEGAMGFIDAVAAGVKTIVTPQGYHLDAVGGITHSFVTHEELSAVFTKIAESKRVLPQVVEHWTWKHYARKHIEIWEDLLNQDATGHVKKNSIYSDGLGSLISPQVRFTNEQIISDLFDSVTRALEAEDCPKAITLLHRCVQMFPGHAQGYTVLSKVLVALGHENEANDVLEFARKANLL